MRLSPRLCAIAVRKRLGRGDEASAFCAPELICSTSASANIQITPCFRVPRCVVEAKLATIAVSYLPLERAPKIERSTVRTLCRPRLRKRAVGVSTDLVPEWSRAAVAESPVNLTKRNVGVLWQWWFPVFQRAQAPRARSCSRVSCGQPPTLSGQPARSLKT